MAHTEGPVAAASCIIGSLNMEKLQPSAQQPVDLLQPVQAGDAAHHIAAGLSKVQVCPRPQSPDSTLQGASQPSSAGSSPPGTPPLDVTSARCEQGTCSPSTELQGNRKKLADSVQQGLLRARTARDGNPVAQGDASSPSSSVADAEAHGHQDENSSDDGSLGSSSSDEPAGAMAPSDAAAALDTSIVSPDKSQDDPADADHRHQEVQALEEEAAEASCMGERAAVQAAATQPAACPASSEDDLPAGPIPALELQR